MKKEYEHFTAEDFIADEYFQQWAQFPDKESNAAWNSWRLQHPSKEPEIRVALTFINSLQFNTRFPPPSQAELSLERNLQKISFTEHQQHRRKKSFFHSLAFRSFGAAMVMTLCALGVWVYYYSEPVRIRIATGENEMKTVVLPDSSSVILHDQSLLAYSPDLPEKKTREIWLEGEGYFAGSKRQTGRFIVHTEALEIEAGNSDFNVKQSAGFTNVTVNSGAIKVQVKNKPETQLKLIAGDFIRYAVSENHIVRKKVNPQLYSAWITGEITLKAEPLTTLTQWLEDISGKKVILKAQSLQQRNISGKIILRDESSLLESLSAAAQVNIVKAQDIFEIYPKGAPDSARQKQ
jgi:ferric-dicitrate binding protein FerR (iron transport regulator)